jgi:hypothetical protein
MLGKTNLLNARVKSSPVRDFYKEGGVRAHVERIDVATDEATAVRPPGAARYRGIQESTRRQRRY